MLFGVPTMYHRLADAAEADERIGAALLSARLLVSGSAPLPAILHRRIERLTGQRIVERYGMTETLMICSVRADGERAPGYVGPPVDGVDVRLVDDAGAAIHVDDDETLGEVQVKSQSVQRLSEPARSHRCVERRRLVSHRRHRHPPGGR